MNKPGENMNELSLNEMEQITGGADHTVNTGMANMNAALRKGPSKSSGQIASLSNGTHVNTLTDDLIWDPDAGRHFVEIEYYDKSGVRRTGWIASSLIGMKR